MVANIALSKKYKFPIAIKIILLVHEKYEKLAYHYNQKVYYKEKHNLFKLTKQFLFHNININCKMFY